MTVLCQWDLPRDMAGDVIAAHPFPDDAILMVFTPVEANMEPYRSDPALFGRSEEGRVFSREGELRWRRIDDFVRMVYLGERMPEDGRWTDASAQLEGLRPVLSNVLLWGIRSDLEAEWLEHQMPKRLVYPIRTAVHPRGRVKLVVENWLDEAGIARFGRYHHLEEVEGEPDHATE
ncbi:type III-D CRISPR-associated protein Csx19 [Desulfatirhabdium butyrativorans]|uniref:type III-D CRISPR-associated protein Csx19 n=1 Tax=Desulfatirhabdium butyrativorans TaxID=340467 RepID=UPI00040836B2|nr:CRISPR-associated protein Csx19 [Desulfatirhabdium butyrativorans]